MILHQNYQLKPHNTLSIESKAKSYGIVENIDDLNDLYNCEEWAYYKIILGGGSNVLFTQDFDGLIVKNNLKGIEILEEDKNKISLKVGAGEQWQELVMHCIDSNYGGIENLSLIPGLVGAAPMQNIGAYGVELKDVFESLEAFEVETGQVREFSKEECHFGYRESVFKRDRKNQFVILNVTLTLTKNYHRFHTEYGTIKETLKHNKVEKLSIKAISDAIIQIRQSKLPDPVELPNAGSFFKNPTVDHIDFEGLRAEFPDIPGYKVDPEHVKIPAAWMIEYCGWKGKRRGAIGVHEKQALVLVNYGGGKGSDLLSLSKDIQQSVADNFGIELEPEVNII